MAKPTSTIIGFAADRATIRHIDRCAKAHPGARGNRSAMLRIIVHEYIQREKGKK